MTKDNEKDIKKKGRQLDLIQKIFTSNQDKEAKNLDAENVQLIISEWLAPKHIRFKTRYTKRQVMSVSVLQSLADTYKITTLKRFLKEFRTNKLSEDGKTSTELENILKSRIVEPEETGLEKLSKFLE